MKRFCVAIDGHEKKVQLTRGVADALNKAELPGVVFTARGTRCPADSEGLVFYNAQYSYGSVDKFMPNGNLRMLINHINGGIGIEAFLREFLDKWTAANSPKLQP
jgi:hypothetical protein